MRLVTLLIVVFLLSAAKGQESFTGYISDGRDDVTEPLSQTPVFHSEYLVLGRTAEGLSLRIGLRYQNVTIPKGSEILSAYIQFTSFSERSDSVTMRIFGELSPDAAPFDSVESEVYNRPATNEVVMWETGAWQAFIPGPAQRTPDLKEIVQEIIDQGGWRSGNALHIKMYKFSFGEDSLLACSSDYVGSFYGPTLTIEYNTPTGLKANPDIAGFTLYPNPVTHGFFMKFHVKKAGFYEILLTDLNGRNYIQLFQGQLSSGDHQMEYQLGHLHLPAGMYDVSIRGNENRISRRLQIK